MNRRAFHLERRASLLCSPARGKIPRDQYKSRRSQSALSAVQPPRANKLGKQKRQHWEKWRHLNAIPRMREGCRLLFFSSPSTPLYLNSFGERPFIFTRARVWVRNKNTKSCLLPTRRIFIWKQFAALVTDLTNYVEIYGGKRKMVRARPRKQWTAWNLMKLRDGSERFTRKMLLAAALNCYDNRVIYIQISGGAQGLYWGMKGFSHHARTCSRAGKASAKSERVCIPFQVAFFLSLFMIFFT